MRGKTVLILAVVVAGLAAFAWYVDRDRPGSDERRQTADRLLDLDAESVTKVRIDAADGKVVLERRPVDSPSEDDGNEGDAEAEPAGSGEWWQLEPFEARADAARVDGLLDALATLDRQRWLEDVDAAAYGLDAPRRHLTLEADGATTEIAVGDEVPGLDSVAVTVDGGAVELVPSPWLDRLEPDGTGWRSPRLFFQSRDEIRAVRIQAAEATVLLRRAEAGFRIVEPIEDLADGSSVDALLAAIVGLEADEYLDEPDLGETATTILVTLADGSSWTLRLGEDGQAVAGGEGARVDEPAFNEASARAPEDWRSHTLSPVDGYDVDAAVFIDAEGETHLEKVDGDWQRDGLPVGFSAATGPLYALAGAEAGEFLPPGAVSDLQPVLEVEVMSNGVTRELQLFDRSDGDGCIGTVDDRSVALALPPEACGKVKGEVAALREAEPIGAETTQTDDTIDTLESDAKDDA